MDIDCEDQGFGLISDGCSRCATWVDGKRVPAKIVATDGWWKCEVCDGSYGPVNAPTL